VPAAKPPVPWPEYRLQAEVVQGLQPRSHDPFFQGKKGFAGLKALDARRYKTSIICPIMNGTQPATTSGHPYMIIVSTVVKSKSLIAAQLI